MITNGLKEKYEAPLALVRGVFLCENVAGVQSPVDRVELKPWEEVPEEEVSPERISFQIF
jgi:hypothetical protein